MSTYLLLLAQDVVADGGSSSHRGFNWLYIFNPAVVWVFIPIAAILVGAIAKIIHSSQQHRERMAMIAAGLHPDFPPDEADEEVAAGGNLRETSDYGSGK